MALPTNINTREMAKFTESSDDGVVVKSSTKDEVSYSWKYIVTQAGFNVKETAGYLKGIVINTPLADGTISIYNNGSGASNAIGVITQPSTLLSDTSIRVDYDLAFSNGLHIVTGGANQDITVIYK